MSARDSLSAGPHQPARPWKASSQPTARKHPCAAPLAQAWPSPRRTLAAESRARPRPPTVAAIAATSSSCPPIADGLVVRSVARRWIRRLIQHRVEKNGHQALIERASRFRQEPLARLTIRESGSVRAVRGERVVHVGDGHDARAQGNRRAGKPVGVAAAIVALVMVADDERAVGEELERGHDLGAGERMPSHHAPFVVGERTWLAQDTLGYGDLAEVVEESCVRDGRRFPAPAACRLGEPAREGGDTIRVTSRVLVLGFERVGETKQALEDRALQAAVRLLQVNRISERLLVGGPQLVVRAGNLLLARPGDLVQVPQVARVRQRLRQRYVGRHDRVSGTRASTRASRARGEKGLVRYSSAPASRPRARSASWDAAVSMTMGVRAKAASRRSWRQTSSPVSWGICTSRRIRSGFSRRATRSASAPSEASTTRTSASSRVNRTRSRMGGSSSTMRMVVMPALNSEGHAKRKGLSEQSDTKRARLVLPSRRGGRDA